MSPALEAWTGEILFFASPTAPRIFEGGSAEKAYREYDIKLKEGLRDSCDGMSVAVIQQLFRGRGTANPPIWQEPASSFRLQISFCQRKSRFLVVAIT